MPTVLTDLQRAYVSCLAPRFLLASGRATGKTYATLYRLALHAIARPGEYILISGIGNQIEPNRLRLFEMIRDMGQFCWSKNQREIALEGGSHISLFGKPPTAGDGFLRGRRVLGIGLDDAVGVTRHVYDLILESLRHHQGWLGLTVAQGAAANRDRGVSKQVDDLQCFFDADEETAKDILLPETWESDMRDLLGD